MNFWSLFKKKFISKNLILVIPFIIVMVLLVITPAAFILVYALTPVSSSGVAGNYQVIDSFIWQKIAKSLWIAIATVIVAIFIAYPLCYFLALSKNVFFKSTVMLLLTAPMWCSLLVKLLGIKSFFDILNGYSNSTYGDIYTLIGMVYIYVPFMLLPLYSSLTSMPVSLVQASQDLGYNMFRTFFHVVIPYTKLALYAGISLVFLPCFTTVAVPQFLNNSNSGALIGDIIFEIGSSGISNNTALIIISSISLIVILIAFAFLLIIKIIPNLFGLIYSGKLKQTILRLRTKIIKK